MKAFVTGGTGFLGINLIKQLAERNWTITAICRPNADTQELADINVDWRVGHITKFDDVLEALDDDVDVIFHLAGDTNMWRKNNARQFEVNVTATEHLVNAALKKNIPTFIHTSSISAYGFHKDVIDEETPSTAMLSSINYLRTKFLGEQVVKNAVINSGLNGIVINPCAIMGPYDKQNWSQLFTLVKFNQLPGVPNGEGSYCHVSEVAKAHISAVTKGKAGENYILAGVDHSFLDVVNKIAIRVGRPEYRATVPSFALKLVGRISYLWSCISNKEPDMTPEKANMVTERVVATSEKAKRELGYDPTVTLDVMLDDCFEYLSKSGRLE
jgi:dihydroflavonol-4-reductase